MRDTNIKVTFDIKWPYKNADRNGVLYAREAVEKATGSDFHFTPISFSSNSGDPSIIGFVTDSQTEVEWDDDMGVCVQKVNGILFAGGTSCVVDEMDNGVVKRFHIQSFGISEI